MGIVARKPDFPSVQSDQRLCNSSPASLCCGP